MEPILPSVSDVVDNPPGGAQTGYVLWKAELR